MNWDQIESKWTLMTRRIRADFGDGRIEATQVSVRTIKRHDPVAATIADSQTLAVKEPEFKISAK